MHACEMGMNYDIETMTTMNDYDSSERTKKSVSTRPGETRD